MQNSQCISDEITCFVPKNDFCKKSGANYEALVVQIRHGSYWIDINLSFFRKLARNPLYATIWWIILKMWSNILENWCGTILKHILGRCFTKIPLFDTRKMKNDLSFNKIGNFLVQHCVPCQNVHVCTNMVSCGQAMQWQIL